MKFADFLRSQEGMSLKPYRDTEGKLTIGVGRNLDDVGISEDEALMMLETDIARVTQKAMALFPWFPTLSEPRQLVVLSMMFNLGVTGFLGFKDMIRAIEKKDFSWAAKEMLDSKWAYQVKDRAIRLSNMMEFDTEEALHV